MDRVIRIGSRGSDLALWQAHYVQDRLSSIGVESTIKIIKTRGDAIQNIGFSKMEGKGFFTKEIEEELIAETIDLAVHSMKDLPTTHPEGLSVTGISYREDPADCLLIKKESIDASMPWDLKKDAIIGTSSARRKAQIRNLRPDVTTQDLRGNVPTRIQKLRDSEMDGIVLAAAGLTRLNIVLEDIVMIRLNPKEFIPAPAQGVLAYQTRSDDKDTRRIIQKIHDADVADRISIERKVLNMLDGGCQLPLGVYVEKDTIGNYHSYAALEVAADDMKRVQISLSTKAGMADKIFEALTKK